MGRQVGSMGGIRGIGGEDICGGTGESNGGWEASKICRGIRELIGV